MEDRSLWSRKDKQLLLNINDINIQEIRLNKHTCLSALSGSWLRMRLDKAAVSVLNKAWATVCLVQLNTNYRLQQLPNKPLLPLTAP